MINERHKSLSGPKFSIHNKRSLEEHKLIQSQSNLFGPESLHESITNKQMVETPKDDPDDDPFKKFRKFALH